MKRPFHHSSNQMKDESDYSEKRESTIYYEDQCPNCGSRNTFIEKVEYIHPPQPVIGVRGDTSKISPEDAKSQILMYQLLSIFGILGFLYGLVSGTWGRNGETISLEGSPFTIILFLCIFFFAYVLYLLSRQKDKIENIKKLTHYKCLECSHKWRFPRHLLSLDSSTTNAEIKKSEEFYRKQLDLRTLPAEQKHGINGLSKWLFGFITTVLSAALLWKWRKSKKS